MFTFNNLKSVHLEITNNCQASCPMCNRNINGGLENPLINNTNWTLDDFKQIMNQEVLDQIHGFYFCGNFGDPILNNNLIDMCRHSKDIAPAVSIDIHTNGSARKTEWWAELATALPSNHSVVFALDGLEDTHSVYRVGTNFKTIIENATAFISAGGNAQWAFIKFKHNEHQVEDARKLAIDLGFRSFTVKNSSRFILEPKVDVKDKQGNITHIIEPSSETPLKFIDKKVIDSYKTIISSSTIDCKVLKTKEIYIDAHKNLFACCWLASVPYTYLDNDGAYEIRAEMLKQHHKMIDRLGIVNTLQRSIKEIINSNAYQTIWDDCWSSNKMITCVRTCGVSDNIKFSQPSDQFEKTETLDE
jgi:hypothetical protein